MPADMRYAYVGIEVGERRTDTQFGRLGSLGSEREASCIRPSACCLVAAGMRRGVKSFGEIPIDHEAIDRGERHEVREGDSVVNLVDGPTDQPELDHWTVIFDETCVRGTARGRQPGCLPGDLNDGVDDEVEERAARGQEHLG